MLTVKLYNGDETTERSFYINDVQDLKRVMDNILDDFQKTLEQSANEDKIMLERLVDKAGVNDVDELEDWIEEAYEMKDALDSSDFTSIDDMTDRIETLENAIDDIFHSADDVRRW